MMVWVMLVGVGVVPLAAACRCRDEQVSSACLEGGRRGAEGRGRPVRQESSDARGDLEEGWWQVARPPVQAERSFLASSTADTCYGGYLGSVPRRCRGRGIRVARVASGGGGGQRGERASGGERCGRYNLGGKGRKRRFATLIR